VLLNLQSAIRPAIFHHIQLLHFLYVMTLLLLLKNLLILLHMFAVRLSIEKNQSHFGWYQAFFHFVYIDLLCITAVNRSLQASLLLIDQKAALSAILSQFLPTVHM